MIILTNGTRSIYSGVDTENIDQRAKYRTRKKTSFA